MGILKILELIASPVSDYFEGKREEKRFSQEIKAEIIKHENERMKWITINQSKTWKDEALTLWVLGLLTALILPWTQPYVIEGVKQLALFPDFMKVIVIGTFTAGLGINGYNSYKRHQ